MHRKKEKIRDFVQGAGSLWAIIMAILFLGNKVIFYKLLFLSLIAFGLLFVLFIIVRKRRFGHIFKQPGGQDLLVKLGKMQPEEFEDFIACLYRRLGYITNRLGGTRGGGVDVIAKKNEIIHYIKCKKYTAPKITFHDVRDFYGAMANNPADGKGIFVTINIFTTDAVKFAEDKLIELVDGSKLLKLIKKAGKGPSFPLLI